MTTRTSIDSFLAQPALAVIGMSRSGKKFGNAAFRELTRKGYRVHPIHPTAETIGDTRCYRRFADLPEPVNAALIVVPPGQALEAVRDAAAAGVRHVWLQQGAESPEAIALCAELGVDVVAGECILMYARPTGLHKAHRWVWWVLSRLPKSAA